MVKHRLNSVLLSLALLLASTTSVMADKPSPASPVPPTGAGNPAGPAKPGLKYARGFVPKELGGEPVDEAETARRAQITKAEMAATAEMTDTDMEELLTATNDGRVYNVLEAVNIRSCAGTSCSRVGGAHAGADLENDASGGYVYADGYYWIRVVYAYDSTDPCATGEIKGWCIVDPLAGGSVHVVDGPLNIRSSPCSGSIITTVSTGTTLGFYQGDNQWSKKWYEIRVPGTLNAGWVDGWDYCDVY